MSTPEQSGATAGTAWHSRFTQTKTLYKALFLAGLVSTLLVVLVSSTLERGPVSSYKPVVQFARPQTSAANSDGENGLIFYGHDAGNWEKANITDSADPKSEEGESRVLSVEEIEAKQRAVFASVLKHHHNPIEMLRYCNSPADRGTETSNYLVSPNGQEGTFLRLDFGKQKGPEQLARYNPSVLPFPSGYEYPYIGFALQKHNDAQFYDVVYCEMTWAYTKVSGRKILQCVDEAKILPIGDWPSGDGVCHEGSKSQKKQPRGPSDPKAYFSPMGEPLLLFVSNGKATCMSQYIVDLRTLIPGLAKKMAIEDLAIRYKTATELPRDKHREAEGNWVMMYDNHDVEFVQHEMSPRSIGRTSGKDAGHNLLTTETQTALPKCIKHVLNPDNEDEPRTGVGLRQATNTLRVTLCSFPCIPTIHNTVLVSLMHVRYSGEEELFYRRYAIVMNATEPFRIVARTNNLVYAGTDESSALYSVSMNWDIHLNKRRAWNSALDSIPYDLSNDIDKVRDAEFQVATDDAFDEDPADGQTQDPLDLTGGFDVPRDNSTPNRRLSKRGQDDGELINVDGRYHGWIDDVVVIGFGLDDRESGILQVTMKDVLECMFYCIT